MNALDRVTSVLERARIDGGWTDEVVAHRVLIALGLDEDGNSAASQRLDADMARQKAREEAAREPTSSNLEHG